MSTLSDNVTSTESGTEQGSHREVMKEGFTAIGEGDDSIAE